MQDTTRDTRCFSNAIQLVICAGYDQGHPMLLVLDCETEPDVVNRYHENRDLFESQMRDPAWLKQQRWFIIDGAHRHELCKKNGITTVRCTAQHSTNA